MPIPDVLPERVAVSYGQDVSAAVGLLDVNRPHLGRDPVEGKKVLVSGVPGKRIVVTSFRAMTRFPTSNPLGTAGSVPFIFTVSYGSASTDLFQGAITQSSPYISNISFALPTEEDLVLYVVSTNPVDDVLNTVDVNYYLEETSQLIDLPAATLGPSTIVGLELWMDAASGVRYNGSYVVSSWTDQSVNDYTATGVSPTAPTFSATSTATLLPAIVFDGGELNGDYLALPNSSVLSTAYPISIFAVVNPDRTGVREGLFTAGSNGDEFSFNVSSDRINVRATTFGANDDTLSDSVIPSGFNMIGITITTDEGPGATLTYYKNATSDGSYNVGAITGIVGAFRGIGGDNSDNPFKGGIAELVVYDSVLSSGEMDTLYDYFASKYAL